ncbi:MAG: HDOD domain-containing protein [Oscillospiraceae bacterium]|nr:HDOD domain-containing protein [Oscillospiraceae bacterium]
MNGIMAVPIPIFSASREAKAYYLSLQIGNALLGEATSYSQDVSLHSPFIDLINRIGLDPLTGGKPIFIPVTDVVLTSGLELNPLIDRATVVLMLQKSNAASDANLMRLMRLRGQGFKTAFYTYPSLDALEPFLPHLDYIFCEHDTQELMQTIRKVRLSGCRVKVIAKGIDQASLFNRVASFGADLFEGGFYKLPAISKDNRVSPLQVNYLRLLNQVNQDDFDLGQFAKVVQRDPALAIRFLKMVNTTYTQTTKITSLKHAAAMIGQNEIKRWITTAVASSLSQEKPGEITRISLLRAKFCENLAGVFEMGVHKENLFLMGLFSVLDAILDMPIAKALDMVMIPDSVREALVGEAGGFGEIFKFIKLYEYADWIEVSRIALIKNISVEEFFKAYCDALLWYDRLLNAQDIHDDELDAFDE